MANPLLTLYVLTYNRPLYLEQCLKSIDAQSFKKFQLIILDNASTESCNAILEKFHHLNIRYIKHIKNIGSTGNFKYACNMACETPYMMVFHDDDCMHPELLNACVSIMQSYPSLAWVGSSFDVKEFTDDNSKIKNDEYQLLNQNSFAKYLMDSGSLAFSSVVYKTALLKEKSIQVYINTYSIVFDRPLLIDLSEEGGCSIVKRKLVYYRVHPEQDSATGPLKLSHIVNLILSYKIPITKTGKITDQKYFIRWASYWLVQSYFDSRKTPREPFFKFLQKSSKILDLSFSDVFLSIAKIKMKKIIRFKFTRMRK